MNRYQMAKLVSWANKLDTRKRLQKVVFMLQSAGCPLDADFYLHHYGPYSEDVARLADEMVRENLLLENLEEVPKGTKYTYCLSKEVEEQLKTLEQTEKGQEWIRQMAPFEEKAKALLGKDLRHLEFASTILYFQQRGCSWDEAVAKAEKFKGTPAVRKALSLAQQAVASS